MRTLLNRMTPIIRPRLQPTRERGQDPAGSQQVSQRPKGLQRAHGGRCAGLQIRPAGWHESPSPIWQDQDEPQCAVASHPAQHWEGLTLEGMPSSNDGDRRRKAFEVGSVG